MPNGDVPEVWGAIHDLRQQVHENELATLRELSKIREENSAMHSTLRSHIDDMNKRWADADSRRTQAPQYIWWAIFIALTFSLRFIDWIVSGANLP